MLEIKDLVKSYKSFSLKIEELIVPSGDYFVLLGPTGSGKTLLLNLIAGLVNPDQGSITYQGKNIIYDPPEKREFGIVYQDSALFPHLSADDNIAFGLKLNRRASKDIEKKVEIIMDQLEIAHLSGREIINLSGGEKQRVAIARALVLEPKVLLLDEPFSSLDYLTKETMISLIKKIKDNYQPTFFHITHDFEDALSLADQVGVVKEGRIIQTGKVLDVFRRPHDEFIANFVGSKNIFSGELTLIDQQSIFKINERVKFFVGRDINKDYRKVVLQADNIILSNEFTESSARNNFKGQIKEITRKRGISEVAVDIGGVIIYSFITNYSLAELKLEKGQSIFLSFKSNALHFF